jgi:4-hydroxy-4-methyl-2-oxoglutarate aldolase
VTSADSRVVEPRHLDIDDTERIKRFRRAGYGGNVSDALWHCGVTGTVLSAEFRALRPGMVLTGRALPVKLHSLAHQELTREEQAAQDAEWEAAGGHPQKRMMRTVEQRENGTILCFDTGRETQAAHFGEMSCQLAYAHGCRGMLLAGHCRDTEYVLRMPDFPVYSFGTRPNAFGGWIITDVNNPIYLPGHMTHYVRITSRDFIFADNDGAQVIPGDLVDEVLLRVEETFEKENLERKQIADGMPIDEVYRVFGVL